VRVPLLLLRLLGDAWDAGVIAIDVPAPVPAHEGAEAGAGSRAGEGEREGAKDGRTVSTSGDGLSPLLEEQAAIVASLAVPGTPGYLIARGAMVWTQLFGLVNFELFGQFVGSFTPADEFFAFAVERMADFLGLPSGAAAS